MSAIGQPNFLLICMKRIKNSLQPIVTKLNGRYHIAVNNVQKYAGWKRTADTVTTSCWHGTSTTTRSGVAISRTAAVAATTIALRQRKSASLSACGSQT